MQFVNVRRSSYRERLKLDNHIVDFIDINIPVDIFTLNTNVIEKEVLFLYFEYMKNYIHNKISAHIPIQLSRYLTRI